jgi:ribonucleotide reductase alpha subunit
LALFNSAARGTAEARAIGLGLVSGLHAFLALLETFQVD